jgi:DNA-binding MarR family transcriptional regulator
MSSALQAELKQTRPFASLEEEALLNIARTAAVLDHGFAQVLKPYGITATQYNVLRILRGAGTDGLCRNEVGERLIRRVPDVTRLLDRMEEMGLIQRAREAEDRRIVTTRIAKKGLDLLAKLDPKLAEIHHAQVGHVEKKQLRALIEALTAIRSAHT